MRTLSPLVRFLALALVLSGCGGDPITSRELPIIDGVDDPGHPAVGILRSQVFGFLCTGTLVGGRTVLTAAHCLEQGGYRFHVGGLVFPVKKVIQHPDYQESALIPEIWWPVTVADVGVAILEEQVIGIDPVQLAVAPAKPGQRIALVGFGKTSAADDNSVGEKHVAKNAIGLVGDEFLLYGNEMVHGEGGSTCNGDSGGPVLGHEAGEERLLGIHSMGDCVGINYATRAARYRDWIEAVSEGNLGVHGDQSGPAVAIEEPLAGAIQSGSFAIRARAHDAAGLQSVTLLLDAKAIATGNRGAIEAAVDGLDDGEHELRVVAIDRLGNRGEASQRVVVRVSAPPETVGEALDGVGASARVEGGCSLASQPGPASPAALLLLAVALLLRSRRKRRPPATPRA